MNPYWIVAILSGVAQFAMFARWLHRRMRDDEIRRAFVRDMAVNHLPHIYHALRKLAAKFHIEFDEPPPVQFLDLSGHSRAEKRGL